MGTTQDDIRGWIKRGQDKGATHVIVACDTFDWEDYPVLVMPGQDAREIAKQYDGTNMQKLMEVYNLSQDIEQQVSGQRCAMNY